MYKKTFEKIAKLISVIWQSKNNRSPQKNPVKICYYKKCYFKEISHLNTSKLKNIQINPYFINLNSLIHIIW